MLVASLILLLLFIGLLLAPVSVHVHSLSKELYLNIWNICYARFVFLHQEPTIELSILSWKRAFYPLRKRGTTKKKKVSTSTRRKWKRPTFLTFRRVTRILSSFKVKEFTLDMDTRDVILNAYLIPLSVILINRGLSFRINNQNLFQLDLVIENRLIYVVKAVIESFIYTS